MVVTCDKYSKLHDRNECSSVSEWTIERCFFLYTIDPAVSTFFSMGGETENDLVLVSLPLMPLLEFCPDGQEAWGQGADQ